MTRWLLIWCATCWSAWAMAEQVVTLSPRPDISLRYLLVTPDKPPLASLVLFAGGDGVLRLSENGALGVGGNFLVRTRAQWAAQGFQVAVVDAPSDRQSLGLNKGEFRQSETHAGDIAAVIADLRRRATVPVWLVGTSRGTTSAASIAILRHELVAGVVLTSTIDHGRGNVADLPLARITQPALLIQHRQDACSESLLANLQPVVDGLSQSSARELLVMEGGQDRGDPCQPWAWHGYNGIEERVVTQAAEWIRRHVSSAGGNPDAASQPSPAQ
ncbi:alpha/beta hydrolase [uncultured Aquitalea sp.]|uniref:alpha/beta hydrolase n=1 Tax=uncultured Aquitalea sp. TaxID=540272 RepID=UPI0025E2C086|nr:alpha/beta hydrolase [uncultured Aquitalea sp.]